MVAVVPEVEKAWTGDSVGAWTWSGYLGLSPGSKGREQLQEASGGPRVERDLERSRGVRPREATECGSQRDLPVCPATPPAGVTESVFTEPSVWQMRAETGACTTGLSHPPQREPGLHVVCAPAAPSSPPWASGTGWHERVLAVPGHLQGLGCGFHSAFGIGMVTAHSRGGADRTLRLWGAGLGFALWLNPSLQPMSLHAVWSPSWPWCPAGRPRTLGLLHAPQAQRQACCVLSEHRSSQGIESWNQAAPVGRRGSRARSVAGHSAQRWDVLEIPDEFVKEAVPTSGSGAPPGQAVPRSPRHNSPTPERPCPAPSFAVLCAPRRCNAQLQMSAAHDVTSLGGTRHPQTQLSTMADGWTVHILTSPPPREACGPSALSFSVNGLWVTFQLVGHSSEAGGLTDACFQ